MKENAQFQAGTQNPRPSQSANLQILCAAERSRCHRLVRRSAGQHYLDGAGAGRATLSTSYRVASLKNSRVKERCRQQLLCTR
jgi:hypothetical protein